MQMTRSRLLIAASFCLAGALSSQVRQPDTADERIVTTVTNVLAPVTVLNRQGEYVNGLQPQDFRLLDNGKEQSIQVDVAFQPISLVIAVQPNDHVDGVLPKIRSEERRVGKECRSR